MVFPAELTRPGFVALLLARAAIVASLGGANLLSSHLCRRCAAILSHVGSSRVRRHSGCSILGRLRYRWGLEMRLIGGTHAGAAVTIGNASVARAMRVRVGRP